MIKEANISYTPEKIDEFIVEASKEVETAKAIFETSLDRVKGTTIGDVVDNLSAAEVFADKLTKAYNAVNSKHTKYFNIIDMYDVTDMPENVRELEKLVDLLSNYTSDILNLEDAFNKVVSAAETLTNFYSD